MRAENSAGYEAPIGLTADPVVFTLAGERLSGRGWLGAGLILAGMLTAELGGRLPVAPGRLRAEGGRP